MPRPTATFGGVLTLVVSAVFVSAVDAGVRNCKPAWKCATPTSTASPAATPTVTPTATPTATPAPPTGTRPFPAPVTTATYTVPASIDRTGATDVFVALNEWVASVPNGSVLVFPDGGIFRLSQGLMLGSRQHLVFELGTSEFRLTGNGSSHFSSAFIPGYSYATRTFTGGAAHLAFRGGIVRGNDSCPGCPQPLRGENQQAVRCNGSSFIEVTGMAVHAVSGDHTFWDNCNDVWVHHNHVYTAGRNGLTVIKGQRVLGEDNAYDDVGYATFDLEPNFASEASADITFRRNTAGDWQNGIGFASVDGAARGADIRRVTIADNTATGRALQIYVDNKDGVNGNPAGRMTDVRVTDNHGPAGGVLRFQNIDGLTVYGNDGSVSITDCTGVVTA